MSIENLITDNIDIWTSAIENKKVASRGTNKKYELYGIKKLRELILELAVRGKLVPQDPNDEPASVLLERIAQEKEQLVKEKKIKKPKKLPEISDEEKPFELPDGWEWARLGYVCKKLTDGSHNPPRDTGVGFPMLSSQNINHEIIDFTSPSRYVDEESFAKEDKRTSIEPLDILLNIVASIGRSAVVPYESPKFVLQRSVAVLSTLVNSFFLSKMLVAPLCLDYYDKHAKGTAQKGIYLGKLSLMPLAIPPLREQEKIVTKVDELMSLCDQLEQQTESNIEAHKTLVEVMLTTLTSSKNAEELNQNWTRISECFDTLFITEESIDQLKQTILQLAVMGKLVPQDPSDEPASKLLERIAEEKAQLIKDKKIKKQKALPPITDEEKPFELPDGWSWVTLSHLGTFSGGKTPSKSNSLFWNGNIPWVTPKDMKVDKIFDSQDHVTPLAIEGGLAQVELESLLFVARSGILRHSFPVAITKAICTVNQDLKVLTLFDKTLANYIYLMMQGFESYILKELTKTGTTVESLRFDDFSKHYFILPPKNEQYKILNKVNELVYLCNKVKKHCHIGQIKAKDLVDSIMNQFSL